MIRDKKEMITVGFKVEKTLVLEIDKRAQERGMLKRAWLTQAVLLKMAQEDKYK